MTIKYVGNPPKEDGFYLVRADNELTVGEYCGDEWAQLGIDYNVWEYSELEYVIEVLLKLDLEQLALTATKAN